MAKAFLIYLSTALNQHSPSSTSLTLHLLASSCISQEMHSQNLPNIPSSTL